MDRYLDRASFGPTWLLKEEIAQLVLDSLEYGQVPTSAGMPTLPARKPAPQGRYLSGTKRTA
jgi:hypothetical protein